MSALTSVAEEFAHSSTSSDFLVRPHGSNAHLNLTKIPYIKYVSFTQLKVLGHL